MNDVKLSTVALDRDHVLKVALDLMDQVGLEGLTLRRLATELGVQAPALYWHFANKQDLLDQMAEALIGNDHSPVAPVAPIGPGRPWDDWLRDEARARRAVLVGRRDAALLAARTKPTDSAFAGVEKELTALVAAGFTPADALLAIFTLGNYVAGFALEEQAEKRARPEEHPVPTPERLEAWIARTLDGLPALAAAVREIGDPQGDAVFERGVETIIMGLRARLVATRQADDQDAATGGEPPRTDDPSST